MLTVLTLFSALVLTLIILVPVRPSRENVISMPSVRRNVRADLDTFRHHVGLFLPSSESAKRTTKNEQSWIAEGAEAGGEDPARDRFCSELIGPNSRRRPQAMVPIAAAVSELP
jgi:hypothetical protein